jgi:hypothetical protein
MRKVRCSRLHPVFLFPKLPSDVDAHEKTLGFPPNSLGLGRRTP